MHSGFEIPAGIQHHHHNHHHHQHPTQLNILNPENTSATPVLLSPAPTHFLEQIHTSSVPQTLDQHHFLPPQMRLNHHQYLGGGGVSPAAFFPVNFRLGLNEICTNGDSIIDKRSKEGTSGVSVCINEGQDALFRGSEQYALPEARHSSIGITHCWQNPQDSAIKQPQSFWEPIAAEVSNENSEIVDRQENLEMMRHRSESLTNCLEAKNRLLFGELEAIYKRLGTAESNQTGPSESLPVNSLKLPVAFDHTSEASIGEEASASSLKNAGKKRKKKKKKEMGHDERPMARFFEGLVKQVMDHQENLHKRFAEVIERLDGERKEREEAWRNQELQHLKLEAEARAQEMALAASREAAIVSYLERITGQRIDLPSFNPIEIASASASGGDARGLEESQNGSKLNPQMES